ncbi:MAG: DMT family transporter [Gammaproteobacteria bacterium]|nr:DMT family transporter [Gammaproteobacteria bacterium]
MPVQLKLLLATVFWGATPTIGRVLASYEAPVVVVCARFAVAALFLGWFAAAARQFTSVPRRSWWRFAVLGLSGIVLHNALMYKGLETTSATSASIILALIATQVVLLDLCLYRRVPDRLTLAGVVLAFAGTAWVLADGDPGALGAMHFGVGEILIFLSGLSWAVYSVVGRELLDEHSPLLVTTYAVFVGVVMMAPVFALQPAATVAIAGDPRALALIFFLGYGGSALGFLWYYQAVVELGTVGAAVYINLVPLFGVLSAALFLGEATGGAVVMGGALVLAGLMLVNRPWVARVPRQA